MSATNFRCLYVIKKYHIIYCSDEPVEVSGILQVSNKIKPFIKEEPKPIFKVTI